jgi:hypothetical protein
MKTMKTYMTGLLLVIGLFGISVYSSSQDAKPDKKARKEAKRAQMEANFRDLDSLLYTGRYVLEANFLENKYGERIVVTSSLNFIRVDGLNGVLQTGSDFRFGSNGVGGVTAEGTIGGYKISRNLKNLTCSVTFDLMTNLGTFLISLKVTSDNNAQATISGTTSGRLTWDGRLVPLDNSRAFKGTNTI